MRAASSSVPVGPFSSVKTRKSSARVGWARTSSCAGRSICSEFYTRPLGKPDGGLIFSYEAWEKERSASDGLRDQRAVHRHQGHLVRRGLSRRLHPPNPGRGGL